MTEEEVKTIIGRYLASKCLFKPHDPKFVNVSRDKLLLDIVLNREGGEEVELLEGNFMKTDEAINRIISGTKACYKISAHDRRPIVKSVLDSGFQPTLGLFGIIEAFGPDANNLAERLRKACASSTAVQPDPRNPKLKQIMVQGEHVKAVVEYLISRGVQRRWTEVINNAGVKKAQAGKRKSM